MAFEPLVLSEVAAYAPERITRELARFVLVGSVPVESADGRWSFHTRRTFKPPPPRMAELGLTMDMLCWPVKRPSILRGAVRVGRAPSNDVVLNADGVSKLHAELVLDETGVTIKDLGSANGTFVRGIPLESPEHALASGDDVTIGIVTLRFFASPDLLTLMLGT